MRILYVQPGKGVGGSKLSLLDLIKDISKTHSIQVVLSENEPEYNKLLIPYVEKIHIINLPDWSRKNVKSFFVKTKLFLYRVLKKREILSIFKICFIILKEKIDLIHTNNSMTLSGAIAAKIMNKKHIWHIREALGEEGHFLLGKSDPHCFSTINKTGEIIICNSEYTALPFRKYNINPYVIQNGLDINRFEQVSNSVKNSIVIEFNIPKNHLIIGMVGNIHSNMKEHEVFIKVCEIISQNFYNSFFIIFGGDKNERESNYSLKIKELIEELELSNRCMILPFCDDVPGIMSSLDIMIHPTSKEGSGRVVMEAMSAGIPVVGVDSGGIKELIHHGVTGFLAEPKNYHQIAEFTQKLIEDDELRKKMSVNSKKQSLNFSKKLLIDRVNQIYQSLEK